MTKAFYKNIFFLFAIGMSGGVKRSRNGFPRGRFAVSVSGWFLVV
jgi:hypothetical protein